MSVAENHAGEMLKEALFRSGTPTKALAAETNYSVDAYYLAMNGKRKIPQDAREKIASVSILAGLAVAMEATGYKLFSFISGDRHPQTLIRRVEKEDQEADAALKQIPFIILDKQKPEDLSSQELEMVRKAGRETCDRIRADLNLICELDDTYRLGLINYLLDKKEKDR
ncbi:MAG TPA: hypothetical protein DER33_10390 [Syntrophomonas sp.]|jgi:hypothetical protein|uniref:hypothetical protein n=1 Tax=Syntrophomonas wolfei TaxID=863 RepID=UPI000ECD0BFD|nr:hypothetical protein [Syntrophomonas wolfei]HCF71970.1 hypothetical protein [Syntrophomonas sp.]